MNGVRCIRTMIFLLVLVLSFIIPAICADKTTNITDISFSSNLAIMSVNQSANSTVSSVTTQPTHQLPVTDTTLALESTITANRTVPSSLTFINTAFLLVSSNQSLSLILPPDNGTFTQNSSTANVSVNQTDTAEPGAEQRSMMTDAATGAQYMADEVIVKYNPHKFQNARMMSASSADSNARIGARVRKDFTSAGLQGMQVVTIPSNISVNYAIAEYRKNPDVLYAEPNYIYHIAAVTPNDPYYANQWGLHNIGTPGADITAPDAWDISTGSGSVVVAVVDTGVDYNHPDLAVNIWTNPGEIPGNGIDDDHNGYIDDVRGWDFYTNDSDPMDENSLFTVYHGTHCSGIIGAVGNNGVGVSGVSWNVKIMPLRFLGPSGSGTTSGAIDAINYANANGADVISNSWAGTGYSQALKDAIDNSHAVVVCAAGNAATNIDTTPYYPATFSSQHLISVAATDSTDKFASFSNYGLKNVSLAAPGVNIFSTNISSAITAISYQYLSGTSMATPFVAGVAAQVKSVNPGLTNKQLKNVIINNVDMMDSLSGKVNTSGRLNAFRAVLAARRMGQSEKVGLYKNGVWYLDYNGNGFWDASDKTYNFGAPGWIPVVGDWNGDGMKKIGVTNGMNWYLDYNGNGVWDASDKAYTFGAPGWTPETADWNGDGKEEIGVTNGMNWYLDYNGNGVWDASDKAYNFGAPGWTPVLGDWNGDGRTKIGVFNDSWYLDYNGDGVFSAGVDKEYHFGTASGWTPVPGDWNGNKASKIGIYQNGVWYLDYDGDGSWDGMVDKAYNFGATGWSPITGSWIGGGTTNIGVTNGMIWYLDYDGNGIWDSGPDQAYAFGATGWTPVTGKWM
jgi:thermitase